MLPDGKFWDLVTWMFWKFRVESLFLSIGRFVSLTTPKWPSLFIKSILPLNRCWNFTCSVNLPLGRLGFVIS